MTVADFAFYLFAITTVSAGLMVTVARNPVHSVLWLILAFISASGLMVLLGAEFVAMLLLIVYVGAVAVLFLFVVMMLDIDFAALKGEMARYMPLGLLIGVVLIMQLAIGLGAWGEVQRNPALEGVENSRAIGLMLAGVLLAELVIAGTAWTLGAGAQAVAAAPVAAAGDVTNTEALGALIYTKYVYIFQAAGMVLLTAMIGAIVLTHRQRTGVKKQNIARQNAVRPEEAVDVVSVPVGEGVKLK